MRGVISVNIRSIRSIESKCKFPQTSEFLIVGSSTSDLYQQAAVLVDPRVDNAVGIGIERAEIPARI